MGRPLTEEQKQHLRDVWAEKKARKSRSEQAIEHVAGGVLRGELDEIEQAIDKRESKLSRLETDEEVANLRVTSANGELQKVNALIAKSKEKLDAQLRVGESVEKNQIARVQDIRKQLADGEMSLGAASKKLADVKADISERLAYKDRQEKEIEEMIEKGNDRLYEVDQEVKEILRKRDELNIEIADLDKYKVASGISIAAEESKFAELKLRYSQAANKYRTDLMDTRTVIKEEQTNIVELKARAKQITDELVTKGKAAVARESAIASREAELTSRERLLKSRESRYS